MSFDVLINVVISEHSSIPTYKRLCSILQPYAFFFLFNKIKTKKLFLIDFDTSWTTLQVEKIMFLINLIMYLL